MIRTSNFKAHEYIANHVPFVANNLSGDTVIRYGAGVMPPVWRDTFFSSVARGLVDYVVMSYRTPIAWHTTNEGWIIPPVKYSVTSSKHLTQSRVRDLVSA